MDATVECAKLIRKELTQQYPNVKFSVVKTNFSTISITWTDGVTADKVRDITKKYEMGYYDAMEDIYQYNNVNKDIPQAQYISLNRKMSDYVKAKLISNFESYFGKQYDIYRWDDQHIIYRWFIQEDF